MPSPAEIAYREAVRALEGQSQDLENIRSHVSLALSAGGLTAAFLGGLADERGMFFWVAVAAFAVVVGMTIRVYWPVEFPWDFDAHNLVQNYVDRHSQVTDDEMMRALAIYAGDAYQQNRRTLDGWVGLWGAQTVALVAFGTESLALLINLVVN